MSADYRIRIRQIRPFSFGIWVATVIDGPGVWSDDIKMMGWGLSKVKALLRAQAKITRKRNRVRNYNDSIEKYTED